MTDRTELRPAEREALYAPDRRLNAYYFGFDPTGVPAIDAILSAVAYAGKGYHHTESWGDESRWGEGRSYVDVIQAAANDAANRLDQLAAAVERDRVVEPETLKIMDGWLVEAVGEHTCGGYGPESGYTHEPGCGYWPLARLDGLEGWPGDQLDAAEAALARVRELHARWPIHGDGDHPEACDCGDPWMTVCRLCCTDGEDQHETCATYHDHGPDKPICPTIAAIGGEQS